MKKASKVLSASLALALGLSLVSYGTGETTRAVAEPVTQTYATQRAESGNGGYLFVTFVGEYDSREQEQIYFGLSKDGLNWMKVNSAQPVLKTNVGEQGVRDPSIIRKPDGSGFYIVATDLSIYRRSNNEIGSGNAWGDCQREGSHSLVVWESSDLVNWSEPWLTDPVAVDEAGCAWAPEAFWDATRQQYMVFWASMVGGRQRIYRSFTPDFKTFTPAEIYMDEGGRPWIDASIIEDNGMFYRFTKDEDNKRIYMEKSASLDGPFEMVDTYTLDGVTPREYPTGFEGPTCVKMNGEDKWCLFLDDYGGKGYTPYFTDDLSEGKFTKSNAVKLDGTFRHGSILPITDEEYNAICEKWMPGEGIETGELIYSLDFNQQGMAETIANKATPCGNVTYEERAAGSGNYAAVINGNNNYIKIDGAGLINGLDSMTVSFSASISAKSWMFFAAPNEDTIQWGSTRSDYLGVGYLLDGYRGIRAQRLYQRSEATRPASADKDWTATNQWIHITLVYRKGSTELYLDGELAAKVSSSISLKDILGDTPIMYLGKATWGGGEYSNYKIDNFKIYNYARSGSEVLAEYNSVK